MFRNKRTARAVLNRSKQVPRGRVYAQHIPGTQEFGVFHREERQHEVTDRRMLDVLGKPSYYAKEHMPWWKMHAATIPMYTYQ